jgi:hypothetical protein
MIQLFNDLLCFWRCSADKERSIEELRDWNLICFQAHQSTGRVLKTCSILACIGSSLNELVDSHFMVVARLAEYKILFYALSYLGFTAHFSVSNEDVALG